MGRPLPPKIAQAPVLHPGLELYWTAFHELNTCRSYGFTPGPIPFTAIMDYARAHEFSEDQTETLFHHVRVMDQAYLDYNHRKSEQRRKSALKSKSSRIGK